MREESKYDAALSLVNDAMRYLVWLELLAKLRDLNHCLRLPRVRTQINHGTIVQ